MRGVVALFCCSLIATLSACGGKIQAENSAKVASCTYNGRQYPAGSTFLPDSCNTCNCDSDGEPFCTHRACVVPVDAGVGGSPSYVDAAASGGGSAEATCAGYDVGATAVDASVLGLCINTVLVVNARTPNPCGWPMPLPPAGSVFELEMTQLFYLPSAGGTRELPQAGSLNGCSSVTGGRYYDDPIVPSIIRLCPCTCAVMTVDQLLLRMQCRVHTTIV